MSIFPTRTNDRTIDLYEHYNAFLRGVYDAPNCLLPADYTLTDQLNRTYDGAIT